MTDQDQSEFERHRAIILATLDYNYEREVGRIVFDDIDNSIKYYERQKAEIEKYYKQRRLDKLQQRLSELIKALQFQVDLNFSSYLKENTGYDIDLFEELTKCVEKIVAQNVIRNDKEANYIAMMVSYRFQTSGNKEYDKNLVQLLDTYADTPKKNKTYYSEIISEIEVDGGVETVERFCTGPKPELWEDEVMIAPDGNRRLTLTHVISGAHASTGIDINFDRPDGGSGGSIYSLDGIHRDVKAFWKDNQTIVIETKKDYVANTKCTRVRSFADEINIEYVEIDLT